MGYAVGTGELAATNWAARIRNVQRRLATATKLATSVEHRVSILNVIMLPAVLFTAAVFDSPPWAERQLRNIQKHFLWRQSTSIEGSRHKINPALLHTPKQAGGASVHYSCMQHAKGQTGPVVAISTKGRVFSCLAGMGISRLDVGLYRRSVSDYGKETSARARSSYTW